MATKKTPDDPTKTPDDPLFGDDPLLDDEADDPERGHPDEPTDDPKRDPTSPAYDPSVGPRRDEPQPQRIGKGPGHDPLEPETPEWAKAAPSERVAPYPRLRDVLPDEEKDPPPEKKHEAQHEDPELEKWKETERERLAEEQQQEQQRAEDRAQQDQKRKDWEAQHPGEPLPDEFRREPDKS